ncbi:Mif2/CENP-C like-domain-containing protein [Fomitopsis serialis]|uniref:Mif2/CENP-C like-domain-containing protein n=1 Tax=Fomitopsis serialis TaxID=139415 RepID=UPI0020077608|nr:Mif2/CENP-C like-domain-containing protein [Neoantrodia serialis]KAH9917445.1 Mif2/CENP-C like-domain-containing protein [Neoantrodia serialis]
MPPSARKSSVGGARRAPTKYIPYRADDFQHGKKTGMAVAYVDHRSDEFEPFDKVMSQADQRTPPRVQNSRKRRAQTPKPKTPRTPAVQEVDEDGEMSMELEDSIPNSPSAYFANARVNTITSSVPRVGSSSRPVAHSSDVDFDKVPSPRESPAFSHRRSLGQSRNSGPSNLSQSTVAQGEDEEPVDDGMEFGGPDFDGGGGFDSDDDEPSQSYQGPQSSQRRSSVHTPRRTSFAQMDQDDEDEREQVEQLTDNEPTPKAKGKQRDTGDVPQPDYEMEDNISRGLAEVEQEPTDEEDVPLRKRTGQDRGDDDSIEKHQRPSKKARTENEGAKKPRGRPKGSKNYVLREVTPNDENTDGLRRGRRLRYKPLDWWRLEKVVYGRRETGTSYVPTIKEIHRIPKEEPLPLGAKHRRKRPPRSKSKTADEAQGALVFNPEEGWDEDTQAEALVIDYKSKEDIPKRIAFTAKMVTPKAAANNDFYFQKVFGDADFIAAGELIIPPDGQKPTKSTKDNTFVFYVIEGAVNLTVHKTSFILATGGMFLVPRGNMYHIRNISERDAKLFFAQARKVSDEEMEEDRRSARKSRGSSASVGPTTAVRSSSEPQPPATAAGAAALKRAASSRTK